MKSDPPSTREHVLLRALGLAGPVAALVAYGLVAAQREQASPETWLGVALWAFMVFLAWAMLMGVETAQLHEGGDVPRRNANLVALGVALVLVLVGIAALLA